MESYFARLLENKGAKELILLSDNASLQRCHQRREKTIEQWTALRMLYLGPPNCPLRKTSRDNLIDLGKGKNKKSPRKKAALKDFFDEVTPGLRSRQKTKNKMTPLSWSTTSGKARHHISVFREE
jgi:hypothetical protein